MAYLSLSGPDQDINIEKFTEYLINKVLDFKIFYYFSLSDVIGFLPIGELLKQIAVQKVADMAITTSGLTDQSTVRSLAFQITNGFFELVYDKMYEQFSDKLNEELIADITYNDLFGPGGAVFAQYVGTGPDNLGELSSKLADAIIDFANSELGYTEQGSQQTPEFKDEFGQPSVSHGMFTGMIERDNPLGIRKVPKTSRLFRPKTSSGIPVLPLAAAGIAAIILLSK